VKIRPSRFKLCEHLLRRRVAFTGQVSGLSQRVLLLLLAHFRLDAQFIVVAVWRMREWPGTIVARRSR
jgi:hypothetical protein